MAKTRRQSKKARHEVGPDSGGFSPVETVLKTDKLTLVLESMPYWNAPKRCDAHRRSVEGRTGPRSTLAYRRHTRRAAPWTV
jgi:hypothetical protein